MIAGALLGSVLFWPLQSGAEALGQANANEAFFTGALLDAQTLENYRGGSEFDVSNESFVSGTVGGNQAYNLSTGDNLITEGSFAGTSGFATVVQNSGNNVLIQTSTIINLQVQ